MQSPGNPHTGTWRKPRHREGKKPTPGRGASEQKSTASGPEVCLPPQERAVLRAEAWMGPRPPSAHPCWPGERLVDFSNTQGQDLGPVSCLCL